jgi:hypothetical protein
LNFLDLANPHAQRIRAGRPRPYRGRG